MDQIAVVVASSVLPSAAPIILIGIGACGLPLIAGRLKLPAAVLELIFWILALTSPSRGKREHA